MERNLIKPEYKLNSSDRKSIGLVLHMHDELIYEVPKSKLREVAKVLKFSMENCVKMTVPLLVKVKSGANWGQMVEEKNL